MSLNHERIAHLVSTLCQELPATTKELLRELAYEAPPPVTLASIQPGTKFCMAKYRSVYTKLAGNFNVSMFKYVYYDHDHQICGSDNDFPVTVVTA